MLSVSQQHVRSALGSERKAVVRSRDILVALLVVLSCAVSSSTCAQNIRLGPIVPVSPPDTGWHSWSDVEADSNDSHHLITCGSKWSSHTNSLSGFLYASFDEGRSWQSTVTEESSPWVSEESCAFGPEGRAFFIVGVSKVFDGELHHELGEMRLYNTEDAGRTWRLPLVWNRWADFTTMTVDDTSGDYRGRVYVFYNDPINDPDGTLHTEIRLISSDDKGKSLKGPSTYRPATGVRYKGSFPTSARVLQNGSVIAVFFARREVLPAASSGGFDSTEVVMTEDGGKTLSTPVQVMRTIGGAECRSDPVMGVDNSSGPFQGRIYIARPTSGSSCQIMLIHSSDNGKTWSRPRPITIPNSHQHFLHLALGVNRKGVIGLAFAEKEGSCWRFSASTDGGVSFLPSVLLSSCTVSARPNLQFLNPFLWAIAAEGTVAQNELHASASGFTLRGETGVVWKTKMAVTSDGLFHPVWMEGREGEGRIWTAGVSVGEDQIARSVPTLSGLQDVSSQTTFDFANNYFDSTTGTVSIDIGIINKTTATMALNDRLLMQIIDLRSDFGPIEVEDSDNGKRGIGAIWDLSTLLPRQPLAPGEVSTRRRILFRISRPTLPPALEPGLVMMRAKMFGKLVSVK